MRRITFAELKGLLTKDRDRAVEATVKEIIEEVRKKGDTALKRYTKKFDGVRDLQIKVSDKEICKAREGIDSKIISVIESAKKRIEKYHKKQMPKGFVLKEKDISVQFKFSPVESVGVYIPAGHHLLCHLFL